MEAMLEMVELANDTSALLKQFIEKVHFKKGKRYQICLDTGESITIAFIPREESGEDSEDSIMKDISGFISKYDAVVNEPDLYDSHYGKDSL
jgi:hypothetical protein